LSSGSGIKAGLIGCAVLKQEGTEAMESNQVAALPSLLLSSS
jgi:hypothetical protein